ncbi:MAG: alpha-L-rhamnosidase [Bacilli bacterium]|nr:alpha-L-rhamnosidase [Bacilli bacterium]
MDKVWQAKWIMDPQFHVLRPIDYHHKEHEKVNIPAHKEELKNQHMLVRKTFFVSSEVQSAFIDITADDYYKLYVNGKFVGQGPAQGNYYYYYYNRFDLKDFLIEGTNVIAVHVYYQGLVCRAYNSGDYRQGMIAEVTINDKQYLVTNHTWKYNITEEYGRGEIIGYNTQFAEHIDNRLKFAGWRSAEFNDNDWAFVREHYADDHRLFLQPTPPIDVYAIKPANVEKITEGHYLIDFGQEITGQFRMKAKGSAGETIEVRCGEELNEEDKSVKYMMRCNCLYREIWTLSGGEDELDFFDYKAFRYVEVIGTVGVMDSNSFGAIVRHYPLNEGKCRFDSSNSLLNQIWEICKNGVKYGSQENYVDCPSREKGQYLGDNTIITHAHAYLSGDLRLFKKALLDFAILSARVCPGFVAVAPGHLMQEIADFSFQWPIQLLQYYKQSADIEFLQDMYPFVESLLQYFKQYKREDGLLHLVTDKWNLVDWPVGMRDGYDFELKKPVGEGCHNVINAFYFGAMLANREIKQILNLPIEDDMEQFAAAFRSVFYDVKTGLFVDREGSKHSALHSNALPLLFGLVPDEATSNVVAFLKEKRLNCGVYMSYFVLKAFAAAGEHDFIYELISSDDLHSWGNMVKEGATTCFEAWSKELKLNTSLCHAWASAPIPVLIEEIFGLTPLKPGWNEIRFAPHIPKSLDFVSLEFEVKTGKVKLEFRNGDLSLTVPQGVKVVKEEAVRGSQNHG